MCKIKKKLSQTIKIKNIKNFNLKKKNRFKKFLKNKN